MSRETHAFGSKLYISGEKWEECDRCGFDFHLSKLIPQFNMGRDTGLLVCPWCVDEPNRDEFVREHPMRTGDDSANKRKR